MNIFHRLLHLTYFSSNCNPWCQYNVNLKRKQLTRPAWWTWYCEGTSSMQWLTMPWFLRSSGINYIGSIQWVSARETLLTHWSYVFLALTHRIVPCLPRGSIASVCATQVSKILENTHISYVHSKQLSMLRVKILNTVDIDISSPLFTRISQLEVFQGVNLIFLSSSQHRCV